MASIMPKSGADSAEEPIKSRASKDSRTTNSRIGEFITLVRWSQNAWELTRTFLAGAEGLELETPDPLLVSEHALTDVLARLSSGRTDP